MARDLKELQKRYNSATSNIKGGPARPRGRGPRGARATGKPKNTKATIKRILSYVSNQKLRLLFVAICMLISTVSQLIGSFMLAPIINKLAVAVNFKSNMKLSFFENLSDNIISSLSNTFKNMFLNEKFGELLIL